MTFDYRDRRDGNKVKQATIPAAEFIRRFLQHVVPRGFCRVRHFGFLGNRFKEERLQLCRTLLGANAATAAPLPKDPVALLLHLTGNDVTKCPRCHEGKMEVVERLPGPRRRGKPRLRHADSS